jgi:hypothetical protein
MAPEIHFDKRGELAIENIDELAERYPKLADRAINSALGSAGFELKNALQDAINQGGPEGRSWERLHPYTELIRKRKKRTYKRTPKFNPGAVSAKSPLLRFKGGIRYALDKDTKTLSAGFVNPKPGLLKMLGMHARGWTTNVTRKMQKKFFAMGLPIATGKVKTPGRPLIEPVWEAEQERITQHMERKFFEALKRYQTGGAKA